MPPPPHKAEAKQSPYKMLSNPKDREHIAEAIVTAATAELARAVLLLVKDNVLTGWKAAGVGVDDEKASGVKLTLDAPTLFQEVVRDKVFYKGPVLQHPQNTQMLTALGGGYPTEAVAYPLIIKGKVVGVLYGDNGEGAMISGDIKKLVNLMSKASMSLEILILKNKILIED